MKRDAHSHVNLGNGILGGTELIDSGSRTSTARSLGTRSKRNIADLDIISSAFEENICHWSGKSRGNEEENEEYGAKDRHGVLKG